VKEAVNSMLAKVRVTYDPAETSFSQISDKPWVCVVCAAGCMLDSLRGQYNRIPVLASYFTHLTSKLISEL